MALQHVSRFGVVLGLFLMIAACSPALGQFRQRQPQAPKGPWMDRSLSPDQRADMVLAEMTLDEKISLVHGAGFPGFGTPSDPASAAALARSNGGAGIVPGIPRLGLPDLNMADSSVGVTRGALRSRYSTALPSTLALAASWDPDLAQEYGALIGRELRDQGYNVSLAGGVDIAREPRNGRNFEYQGEDPILAGRMAGHLMRGLQEQHVIGDLKHYAVNDQETGRNVANARLDKRALRETDLLAFQIALKESDAGMVMAAYNRVNGDYCSENSYLLTDVLKRAWGFKGFVLSDWGGTHSTVKAALAGLDQEQPGGQYFGEALKKAVQNGEVPMSRLNDMVHRILRTEFASGIVDYPPVPKVVDVFGGLDVAQRVAEQSIVLLKNERGLLPLNASRIRSIAVIGSHADVGVLSGGGSAQVDPPGGNAITPPPPPPGSPPFFGRVVYYPSSPLKALRAKAPKAQITYDSGDDPAAAAALARQAEVAIVFVNQPMSEGRDAATLALPDHQDALVDAVAAANPRTIVVLETGGPVTMPWVDRASGVLAAWYPGIRGAEALANILFGDVNPSAKLPVTFARTEADLPHPQIPGSTLTPRMVAFPGAPPDAPKFPQLPPFDIDYTEGLKVGYKWFDAEGKEPLFPFGHGLSYTTFAYSGLEAAPGRVTFTVRNTGKRAGAEIAQVYIGLPSVANEPPRRLVAWEKVQLAPGASKTITLVLEPQFLSIFNAEKEDWELVPGEYKVFVGGSSRSTPLAGTMQLQGAATR
ncbi:MAG TPA: glycoside hydrolase family 3 C-terminal domain-containing protein [Chthonomonadaceae bacterium]|nr:glycoside hydrolase family 3 C-terminal domain-containing protein [Chthonomonadaceae bacterium]